VNAPAWAGFVVACSLGAVTRYLVDGWVQGRVAQSFPWGIWVVNVSGSFLLGILTGLTQHSHLGGVSLTIAGSGFCGAYTTFSTLALQTVDLAQDGRPSQAALNAFGSLVAGMAAAAGGLWLGSL
jgi:fluoride exporter